MSVLRLRRVRGGLVLAAALLGGPLLPVGMSALQAPAFAADAPTPPDKEDTAAPDLAIGIDDGHTDVRGGDRLTYTVRIRNIGTEDADDLLITQTLPAGARFGSADRDGVLRDGTVTWHTDLPAGRDTTFAVHAEVGQPASNQLRLASVACARVDGDSPPIVCAADSDRLPVGRDAAAPGTTASGSSGWLTASYVGLGVGMVLLAGFLVRRRWWPRPSERTGPGSHRPLAPDLDLDLDNDRHEVLR